MSEESITSEEAMTALRPGVLVVVKSSVRGGAEYDRQELPAGEYPAEGAKQVRAWTTVQRVFDPEELARAKQVRGRAVGRVWNRTSVTPYGLVVPDERLQALDEAVAKAKAEVDGFNAGARHVRVTLRVLKTRLVPEEASEAFEAEAEDVVEDLGEQTKNLASEEDVSAVRKAADRASALAEVLRGTLAERVLLKVREARAAATAAAKAARGEPASADSSTEPKKPRKSPKLKKAAAEVLARAASQASTAGAVARALRSKADGQTVLRTAAEQRVAAAKTDKQREDAERALKRAVETAAVTDKKAAAAEQKAADLEAARAALAGEVVS